MWIFLQLLYRVGKEMDWEGEGLHCIRPDRNFRFHLCPESRIAYLYICVVIVTMKNQRYNLASHNSLRCDEGKASSETVLHFLYILLNPHFDLETDYIVRKPMKHRFQWYIVLWGHRKPRPHDATAATMLTYLALTSLTHSQPCLLYTSDAADE